MKKYVLLLSIIIFLFNCSGNFKTYNKALELQQTKSYTESERLYLEAIKKKPNDPDINNNLGCVYLALQKYDKAEMYLKKAANLKPEDYKFHYNLGLVYQSAGKRNEAIKEFKRCLNLKPDYYQAAYNIGNLYFDISDFNNAILYLKKCIDIKPAFADAFYNLGLLYSKIGDKKKAIENYTRYTGMVSDNYEIIAVNKIIKDLKSPAVVSTEKPAFPANIVVLNKEFVEPSGNNSLDAEETGNLFIEIENKTQYPGKVNILLTPILSNNGVVAKSNVDCGIIAGQEKKKISIPFTANRTVLNQECSYRVEILEQYYHIDPTPFIFSFNTSELRKPELKIIFVDAIDNKDVIGPNTAPLNNNNGLVEKNEMVKVVLSVQNIGQGVAKDVKLEVNLSRIEEENITFRTVEGDRDNVFNLGTLKPGEYKRIPFVFFTSSFYSYPDVEIEANAKDVRNFSNVTEEFKLEMGQTFVKNEELKIEPSEEGMVDITADESALVDVDNVPLIEDNNRDNTLAVIIGIENYKYNAPATYKVRDATKFYQYMVKTFGVPEENIMLRTNDAATKAEIDYIFDEKSGWLKKRITPGKTEVMVYIAGHGYPEIGTQKAYFIPYDVRAEQATNGISLNELYEKLGRLNAKNYFVFIESCFSGISVDNQPLAVNINPVKIKIKFPEILEKDFIAFTAASGQQVSSNSDNLKHGIFSYYLLKSFKGNADDNNDKKLTVSELWRYLNQNVPKEALKLDREQDPLIFPDLNVLKDKNLANKTILEY